MPEKMTAVLAGTIQRAPYCPQKSTYAKAREPVRRTTGRVVGRYPSFKNNRMISWESQLEHKACVLFEFSSAVVAYREQPETIRFWHQGKWCRYTPDFCIETFGGRLTYNLHLIQITGLFVSNSVLKNCGTLILAIYSG